MSADYIHEDNTGRGASAQFMERRRRAAEMMAEWDADGIRPLRRAEFENVAPEKVVPARVERGLAQRTLRSALSGD